MERRIEERGLELGHRGDTACADGNQGSGDGMSIFLSNLAAFSHRTGLPTRKSLLGRYGRGLQDKGI
jgi:hypothetical protein